MENSSAKLEAALLSVWTQVMNEGSKVVRLDGRAYRVRKTRSGLLQLDFTFEGRELRGLEQNPKTNSRWAALAPSGKRIMQFLDAGHYVANVTEGKAILYGHPKNRK